MNVVRDIEDLRKGADNSEEGGVDPKATKRDAKTEENALKVTGSRPTLKGENDSPRDVACEPSGEPGFHGSHHASTPLQNIASLDHRKVNGDGDTEDPKKEGDNGEVRVIDTSGDLEKSALATPIEHENSPNFDDVDPKATKRDAKTEENALKVTGSRPTLKGENDSPRDVAREPSGEPGFHGSHHASTPLQNIASLDHRKVNGDGDTEDPKKGGDNGEVRVIDTSGDLEKSVLATPIEHENSPNFDDVDPKATKRDAKTEENALKATGSRSTLGEDNVSERDLADKPSGEALPHTASESEEKPVDRNFSPEKSWLDLADPEGQSWLDLGNSGAGTSKKGQNRQNLETFPAQSGSLKPNFRGSLEKSWLDFDESTSKSPAEKVREAG